MLKRFACALGLFIVIAMPASAEQLARHLFGAVNSPAGSNSQAIGFYSKGCASGLVQLPETGPTWQAMRLSRNRNWGQPEMIRFLQDLSRFAASQPGWKGLYIGDISQPRGGPMSSGHASHQVGLDADIWMLPPQSLRLSRSQRESISSISVRTKDQRNVTRNWTPQHMEIIKAAASDPRVDRVFVTAAAKIAMCNSARGNRGWLQKVRPIYGHNYHFHVCLKCPKGDRSCVTQKPTVAQLSKGGDGCDKTLMWWVTDYLKPQPKPKKPAKPAPAKKSAKTYTLADLPNQCRNLIAAR